MQWFRPSVFILLLCTHYPGNMLTLAELEAVQQEVSNSCCAIPHIDCRHVVNIGTREAGRLSHSEAGGDNLMVPPDNDQVQEGIAPEQNAATGRRRKRQVRLSERFVDQLGINLLRFETCICQATIPSSTCRMFFPPDFYNPSQSSFFNAAYQEQDKVKRFGCSFYAGNTVDCTLISSTSFTKNMTSEVGDMIQAKVETAARDCISCVPLFCTFDVFKKRLVPTNATFDEDYNSCIQNNTESFFETTTTQTPSPTFPEIVWTTPPQIFVPATERPGADNSHVNQDLSQNLLQIIFPTTMNPLHILPKFGRSGILLGLRSSSRDYTIAGLSGMYFVSEGHPSSKPRQTDDIEEEEGGTSLATVIGAAVGGTIVGAILMAVIIFALFKGRLFTTNVKLKRSLRGLPIVRLDALNPMPSCEAPMDTGPPVARVTPMKTSARRGSTSDHMTPVAHVITPQWNVHDVISEVGEYSGIYTQVEGEEEWEPSDTAKQARESSTFRRTGNQQGEITLHPEEYLAHYEVPVVIKTRPQPAPRGSTLPNSTLPRNSDFSECGSSQWSDSTEWDEEELQRSSDLDLGEGEHEYMEIRPDPD